MRKLPDAGTLPPGPKWCCSVGTQKGSSVLPSVRNGKHIATGSEDGAARLQDTATGAEVVLLGGHLGPVHCVAFSPDGKRIVTGSDDKTAKLWDAATGLELSTLRGHMSGVRCVSFSPNSRRLLTGSVDGTAKLWDAATGAEVATLRGHSGLVQCVAFSPNGSRSLRPPATRRLGCGTQLPAPNWSRSAGKRTGFIMSPLARTARGSSPRLEDRGDYRKHGAVTPRDDPAGRRGGHDNRQTRGRYDLDSTLFLEKRHMASIIILTGPSQGAYYPLGQRTISIGRDEAADIQVVDEHASRKHVQIRLEPSDGQYHAMDMHSKNGVFVNGLKIQDVALDDDDEIVIGQTTVLFTDADFQTREAAWNHSKQRGQHGRATQTGELEARNCSMQAAQVRSMRLHVGND